MQGGEVCVFIGKSPHTDEVLPSSNPLSIKLLRIYSLRLLHD